jgi:hypothetical protein
VQNLVSDLILGVNYLFALHAALDFDHEVIRLCHPTSDLRSTIGFTKRDRDRRRVDSVCALATVPLGPYEQRRVPVRILLDRVGRQGLLSRAGAVSMGSACVAHGYFGESLQLPQFLLQTKRLNMSLYAPLHAWAQLRPRISMQTCPSLLEPSACETIPHGSTLTTWSQTCHQCSTPWQLSVLPQLTSLPHHPRGRYKQTLKLTPTLMLNNAHASENSYSLLP